MKRIISIILAMLILLSLAACGKNAKPTWQEQYDLGVRYLSDGNYEEAIIAFTAAIEIDPKQPAIYEKLTEIYLALGDNDSAKGILARGIDATGDHSLVKKFDELSEKRSLLEVNASTNIIGIEELLFCGNRIIDMDFSTLTATQCITMMESAGFSECYEGGEECEWYASSHHSYNYGETKWGKYSGFGNAGVSVHSYIDWVDFYTGPSGIYYGEEQLDVGVRDICIGASVEKVLAGLGFKNSTEIAEHLYKVFYRIEVDGEDAVEDAIENMLQYDNGVLRFGDVDVENDSLSMTFFVSTVENADFYTLDFHFGARGQSTQFYDENSQRVQSWVEYKDCLTRFEITVFK